MKTIKLFLHQLFTKDDASSKIKDKPDKYKVIMAGNIMVAQGYECDKCNVIRPFNLHTCPCH